MNAGKPNHRRELDQQTCARIFLAQCGNSLIGHGVYTSTVVPNGMIDKT